MECCVSVKHPAGEDETSFAKTSRMPPSKQYTASIKKAQTVQHLISPEDLIVQERDLSHQRKQEALTKFNALFQRPAWAKENKSTTLNTASKSSKSSTGVVKPLQQMFLNLGQKNSVTLPFQCQQCFMTYFRQDVAEERIHSKYHDMMVKGISYNSRNDVVIETNLDNDKVVAVDTHGMNATLKKKLTDILWMVESDLGASPIPEQDYDKFKVNITFDWDIGSIIGRRN